MPKNEEPDDGQSDLERAEEELAEDEAGAPPPAGGTFVSFLASSWRLMRIRFGAIFLAFLLGNLAINATLVALSQTADADTTALGVLFFTGQFLLTAVVGGFLTVAAGHVRLEANRSRKISMTEGFRRVGDMWGHITSASLFTGFVVALFLLGVGLIGFLLGLPLRLGPPILLFVIAFEKLGLSPAWVRARELIRGNALRTFVYLLMLALMAFVMLLLLQRLLGIGLGAAAFSDFGDTLLFTGVTVALYGLLDTALSSGLLVAYLDCRARNDEDFSVDKFIVEDEDGEDGPV